MKLNASQFDAHIAKNLSPIYLIAGEELILKQDACNAIRLSAKQAGVTERVRITPEAGFDWDQLYPALYAQSLLAEKRLLELDFTHTTPNKQAGAVLQEYGNKPIQENVLLIHLSKIDDKISKTPWYKSLEKAGVVMTLWPIAREQLPQWIMQRAKKYKFQLNRDAADLLADYVEGNLSAAIQALEKIYLLQPQQAVDAAFILQVFTDESRFSIFDFTENVLMGESKRSLHMLDALLADGTEPVLILWSMTRELRLLADFMRQIKLGKTIENLLQTHRIFFRRQTAFRRFLSRASLPDCWRLLKEAAAIDRTIKGALPGNEQDALRMFCLGIISV